MPAIPEFLLQRLYVSGSLQAQPEGFSFALLNTFAPATVTDFGLAVDSQPVAPDQVLSEGPEAAPRPAVGVTSDNPFSLAVGNRSAAGS